MAEINRLPLLNQASPGDQVPVYTPANGDARRMPLSALITFFQQSASSSDLVVQFATPTTGFSIAIQDTSADRVWLLIQPASTLASGTLVLPAPSSINDGKEVIVTSTQQITSFSVSLNGAAAVYGEPLVIGAEDFFKLRYYQATNSWYRIA